MTLNNRFLHGAGEIIFLDQGQGLTERVIIDPHWFCTVVMGSLFEPNSSPTYPEGRLTLEQLQQKLQISPANAVFAVQALEKLQLCFKCPDTDEVIVPALLIGADALRQWKTYPTTNFRWVCGRIFVCEQTSVIPPGFFARLQLLLHRDLTVGERSHSVQVGRLWPDAIWVTVNECDFFLQRTTNDQSSEFCVCLCACVGVCVFVLGINDSSWFFWFVCFWFVFFVFLFFFFVLLN